MATAALTPGPKFRYGSYESVEVVETSGSLSRVVTPGGDEFWVKTAKLKPVPLPRSRRYMMRSCSPVENALVDRLMQSNFRLCATASGEGRERLAQDYLEITGTTLPDSFVYPSNNEGTRWQKLYSLHVTCNSEGVLPFVPKNIAICRDRQMRFMFSNNEVGRELLKRNAHLGENHYEHKS